MKIAKTLLLFRTSLNKIKNKILKGARKNWVVIMFLSFFIIIPYLSLISTWSHENAHSVVFSKYGIKSSYNPDILMQIPNFYGNFIGYKDYITFGKTTFDSESKQKYLELSNDSKAEINLAGTSSDLNFLYFILFSLVFLNSIPLLLEKSEAKNKIPKNLIIFWVDLLLIFWALLLIINIQSNMNPFAIGSDLNILLGLWCPKC